MTWVLFISLIGASPTSAVIEFQTEALCEAAKSHLSALPFARAICMKRRN